MQTENQTLPEVQKEQLCSVVDPASLYRTQWLMAHNRLHTIAHSPSIDVKDEWKGYLDELRSAEDIARLPA
jgi:hypothetical protein